MTLQRFVLLVSFVCFSTWITVKADAPTIHLVRQGGTDKINSIDGQLHRIIKWSHGGYVVMDELGGAPPVFYSLDRDGTWTNTAQFRNPEPTQFYSFGYDRQTNGTIVFSGQTETAPRVVSPFLAWTSADGKIQRMVRTDHYFPYEIAVAPDDTVWTLGYEMVNWKLNDPAVNQEAHVLRHFDNAGNLIGSFFPQSQFDRFQCFRITDGLLVATRDRLGWFGPQHGKFVYTEIPLDTMTMKEYPGPPASPSKHDIAGGLGVTSNGDTSVSIQDLSPGERTIYVLDRAAASWVPVSVPPMGGLKWTPNLIGSDGDNLVFKCGREVGFFSVMQ